jgi:hypothetical protein
LDDKELNDFAQQVCALTLTLPHAATGRQNDAGANLQPAGILIIPLATDPAVPGAIYTADLVELKRKKPDGSADGRQGWHRAGFIQDGEEGGEHQRDHADLVDHEGQRGGPAGAAGGQRAPRRGRQARGRDRPAGAADEAARRQALMRALLVLLLAAAPALAQTPPLILDHDMLTAMARTGAPAVEISYTPTRVVFRTRVRVLLGWIDVQAEAVFVREDKRLHLALQALKAGGLVQNASRFFEASKKLGKLVDVETAARRVEIYKAGKVVYDQEVP